MMNGEIIFALSLLIFVSMPTSVDALAQNSTLAQAFLGHVTQVIDGQTLDVARDSGETVCVRLFAVKAPIQGQSHADEAVSRLKTWSHNWGDMATVIPMGEEQGGAVVARVIVGQDDLAEVLTKACLARVDMRLCRERFTPECVSWNAWELQCRDEKKGLWKSPND